MRIRSAVITALLLLAGALHAAETKEPIRGLVSMGAYKFVVAGTDPVNTLEPLNAKPGIFGGIVCIFDNHDLDTKPPKSILPIYASMKRLGTPTEFQTFHETPSDFEGTIQKAVSLGAGSIELWQDYQGFRLQPDAKLKKWAAMIERDTKE